MPGWEPSRVSGRIRDWGGVIQMGAHSQARFGNDFWFMFTGWLDGWDQGPNYYLVYEKM